MHIRSIVTPQWLLPDCSMATLLHINFPHNAFCMGCHLHIHHLHIHHLHVHPSCAQAVGSGPMQKSSPTTVNSCKSVQQQLSIVHVFSMHTHHAPSAPTLSANKLTHSYYYYSVSLIKTAWEHPGSINTALPLFRWSSLFPFCFDPHGHVRSMTFKNQCIMQFTLRVMRQSFPIWLHCIEFEMRLGVRH